MIYGVKGLEPMERLLVLFFIGTSLGSNFKEACDNLAIKDANFKKYYSSNDLTYWGCKLFDNEADARVNFG